MINLTEENFSREVANSATPVIIDFYADWCAPCRMMSPVFERLSPEFNGKLKFLKLDTEAYPEIAMRFAVRGIPSLVIVSNGKEMARLVGYMSQDELRARINSLLPRLHP